jgi:enamine deaminase RidA (YjgF/YER057c/UK114 family)
MRSVDVALRLSIVFAPSPLLLNRDKLPASTAVQVSRLSDPCFLIEIDLVAVVE